MKYSKTFNIWPLPPYLRAKIKPGQWVQAGLNGPKGIYCGQKSCGSDVVAWPQGKGSNICKRAKRLREYAKS